MFAVQLPMDRNSGDSNYKQKTTLNMLILPDLLVSFLHLSCCCCDALIACICSSCECLWRDSFRLPTAPQLHIEYKHNKTQAACVIWCLTSVSPSAFLILAKRGGGNALTVEEADGGESLWWSCSCFFFFFLLTKSVLDLKISCPAGNTAGQFTLSGYACKRVFPLCSSLGPTAKLLPLKKKPT